MSNDRIHAWLDGELSLDALSAEERAVAGEMGAAVEAAAAQLRAGPAPDLSARVMAALPRSAPRSASGRLAAALGWLWSPRPVRLSLRPAYGLAFAAVAAAVLAFPASRPRPSDARPAVVAAGPSSPGAPPVYVQFRIAVPGAHTVALAGTFTGWKPAVALHRTGDGEWTALVPLRPGVHDYAFVVDGDRWVADPNAPQVDDSFGGTNSRISLPPIGAS
ncbi:Glycogen recognition site of AMP-activated protein kinase [bacterium JGI 053]|nr:Glycogen recognition site of AMP-activated protein kinase [bacterium JGI 053]